jgi:tRNA dimethylallyltransferase
MLRSPLPVTAPIFLVGATGTGKSAGAMELARRAGAAILAMDEMQVYRGADIGTGKPSAAERAEIPHGGLDLVDFGAPFDVAQYLTHAEVFLREQREAGRPVIIVGGTGLYFRALTRGLCEAPQGSEDLRAELNALSVEALRSRLERIDPAMLGQIDAANPRRLIRAIEVMEATGRSLREWQAETPEPLVKSFRAFWIQRGKEELHERIERRVDEMFAAGWGEEVRGLVERYGVEAVQAFAGIGYREIADSCGGQVVGENGLTELSENGQEAIALRGQGRSQVQLGNEGNREEGIAAHHATATTEVKSKIIVATRQYAKRQLTWFAREPNLVPVMLSGAQPFPADLLSQP